MRAFPEFRYQPPEFWALVKFVSQELGYTDSNIGQVRSYSEDEIIELLDSQNYGVVYELVRLVSYYSVHRAQLLNNFAMSNLMTIEEARQAYEALRTIYDAGHYLCKIPWNKQKGDKHHVAYLSAIVNILTEHTLRAAGFFTGKKCFVDDPNKYLYVTDRNGYIVGAASRRMDGAYPDVVNPKIVWEIKEYYGTTSFGSRVADGVYETQLDGYELSALSHRSQHPIHHVLIVDDYFTWWTKGKSYLCRLIDILNEGLVDEVLVGREVITRWPEVLRSVL